MLVDAFLLLRKMRGTENARLRLAGWLGERDRPFFFGDSFKNSSDKDIQRPSNMLVPSIAKRRSNFFAVSMCFQFRPLIRSPRGSLCWKPGRAVSQ